MGSLQNSPHSATALLAAGHIMSISNKSDHRPTMRLASWYLSSCYKILTAVSICIWIVIAEQRLQTINVIVVLFFWLTWNINAITKALECPTAINLSDYTATDSTS